VTGFEVTRIDELERLPVLEKGDLTWRPIRRRLGVTAFGVNAYTAGDAGQPIVEEHTERTNGHEEVYLVVTGRATFTVDGDEVDAPAGTLVHLPDPEVRRGAVAVEPGTTVVAMGARRGVPFQPSGWEASFSAYAYRRLGDPERGWSTLREEVERNPSAWQGHYHLACFAALDGDREAALGHLAHAVELDATAARHAAEDPDFDGIRDDPRFPG
jgi:mannose-6-phosphate isomerase-like protein (cupin superfamily)